MFLLRSVFWLGVVFWSMPWTGDLPSGESLRTAAGGLMRSAGQAAGDYCSATPAECLLAAQKLHALFEKVAAEAEQEQAAPKPPTRALPAQSGTLLQQDRAPGWRGKPAG